MSDLVKRLEDGANRFLAWVYDKPYSGPPVISIPRNAGNIDALLQEAADRIEALEAALREGLEHVETLLSAYDDQEQSNHPHAYVWMQGVRKALGLEVVGGEGFEPPTFPV